MNLTDHDLQSLRNAKELLENPSVAVKLTSALGYPITRGLALLPESWSEAVQRATRDALMKALHFAVATMDEKQRESPATHMHKMLVAATGAVSGLAGLPALVIELPISTTIMLRSIADVARSEGEDIRLPECKMACLEVFALGGRSPADDAADTGYFAVRAALAHSVSEAAQFIAQRGAVEEGAPAIVRLVAGIASRFNVAVSEKVLAQAIPLFGAVGGALVNTLFIDHFQDMARGHFTVRRLERTYGTAEVRACYDDMAAGPAG
jgi:hypothetical protein